MLRDWIVRDYKLATAFIERNVLELVPRDRLAERPAGAANSILWCLWHLARTEDLAINVLARGGAQLLDDPRLPDPRNGTGFADDEVAALTASLDPEAVTGYWRAVRACTIAWVSELPVETLDEPVDAAARFATVPDFVTGDGTWLREFWSNRTVGFFVAFPAVNHTLVHFGEMSALRGLLGIPGLG